VHQKSPKNFTSTTRKKDNNHSIDGPSIVCERGIRLGPTGDTTHHDNGPQYNDRSDNAAATTVAWPVVPKIKIKRR
jgi:hypothetical protein